MQHKKVRLCAVLLLSLGLTGLHAQEVIPASCGNASGSGGSASYSVGQIFYTTNTGTNGSVAQGVQQPYEISVVTGIDEAKYITLQCTAYPNPATDILTLKAVDNDNVNLSYQLLDMNGKLLANKKLEGGETSIVLSNFAPATYFLKVTDNKKEVKTFKIIKTQ